MLSEPFSTTNKSALYWAMDYTIENNSELSGNNNIHALKEIMAIFNDIETEEKSGSIKIIDNSMLNKSFPIFIKDVAKYIEQADTTLINAFLNDDDFVLFNGWYKHLITIVCEKVDDNNYTVTIINAGEGCDFFGVNNNMCNGIVSILNVTTKNKTNFFDTYYKLAVQDNLKKSFDEQCFYIILLPILINKTDNPFYHLSNYEMTDSLSRNNFKYKALKVESQKTGSCTFTNVINYLYYLAVKHDNIDYAKWKLWYNEVKKFVSTHIQKYLSNNELSNDILKFFGKEGKDYKKNISVSSIPIVKNILNGNVSNKKSVVDNNEYLDYIIELDDNDQLTLDIVAEFIKKYLGINTIDTEKYLYCVEQINSIIKNTENSTYDCSLIIFSLGLYLGLVVNKLIKKEFKEHVTIDVLTDILENEIPRNKNDFDIFKLILEKTVDLQKYIPTISKLQQKSTTEIKTTTYNIKENQNLNIDENLSEVVSQILYFKNKTTSLRYIETILYKNIYDKYVFSRYSIKVIGNINDFKRTGKLEIEFLSELYRSKIDQMINDKKTSNILRQNFILIKIYLSSLEGKSVNDNVYIYKCYKTLVDYYGIEFQDHIPNNPHLLLDILGESCGIKMNKLFLNECEMHYKLKNKVFKDKYGKNLDISRIPYYNVDNTLVIALNKSIANGSVINEYTHINFNKINYNEKKKTTNLFDERDQKKTTYLFDDKEINISEVFNIDSTYLITECSYELVDNIYEDKEKQITIYKNESLKIMRTIENESYLYVSVNNWYESKNSLLIETMTKLLYCDYYNNIDVWYFPKTNKYIIELLNYSIVFELENSKLYYKINKNIRHEILSDDKNTRRLYNTFLCLDSGKQYLLQLICGDGRYLSSFQTRVFIDQNNTFYKKFPYYYRKLKYENGEVKLTEINDFNTYVKSCFISSHMFGITEDIISLFYCNIKNYGLDKQLEYLLFLYDNPYHKYISTLLKYCNYDALKYVDCICFLDYGEIFKQFQIVAKHTKNRYYKFFKFKISLNEDELSNSNIIEFVDSSDQILSIGVPDIFNQENTAVKIKVTSKYDKPEFDNFNALYEHVYNNDAKTVSNMLRIFDENMQNYADIKKKIAETTDQEIINNLKKTIEESQNLWENNKKRANILYQIISGSDVSSPKIMEAIMGSGKTAVLTPYLILWLLAFQDKTITICVPTNLVNQSLMTLMATVFPLYKIDICVLSITNNSELVYKNGNTFNTYSQTRQIFIIDDTNLKTMVAKMQKGTTNNINYITAISNVLKRYEISLSNIEEIDFFDEDHEIYSQLYQIKPKINKKIKKIISAVNFSHKLFLVNSFTERYINEILKGHILFDEIHLMCLDQINWPIDHKPLTNISELTQLLSDFVKLYDSQDFWANTDYITSKKGKYFAKMTGGIKTKITDKIKASNYSDKNLYNYFTDNIVPYILTTVFDLHHSLPSFYPTQYSDQYQLSVIPNLAVDTPAYGSEFTDIVLVLSLIYFNFKMYGISREIDKKKIIKSVEKLIVDGNNNEAINILKKISKNTTVDLSEEINVNSLKDVIKDQEIIDTYLNTVLKEIGFYYENKANVSMQDVFLRLENNYIGFTGTPEVFLPYKLSDTIDKKYDDFIKGKVNIQNKVECSTKSAIKYIICQKAEIIHTYETIDKCLELFVKKEYDVLIDVGGIFVGMGIYDIRDEIIPKLNIKIKYVLYPVDGLMKCYDISNKKEISLTGLENKNSDRVFIFDNKNITGIDAKNYMNPKARGIVTIGPETNLINLSQGIFRMRNILDGQLCNFAIVDKLIEFLKKKIECQIESDDCKIDLQQKGGGELVKHLYDYLVQNGKDQYNSKYYTFIEQNILALMRQTKKESIPNYVDPSKKINLNPVKKYINSQKFHINILNKLKYIYNKSTKTNIQVVQRNINVSQSKEISIDLAINIAKKNYNLNVNTTAVEYKNLFSDYISTFNIDKQINQYYGMLDKALLIKNLFIIDVVKDEQYKSFVFFVDNYVKFMLNSITYSHDYKITVTTFDDDIIIGDEFSLENHDLIRAAFNYTIQQGGKKYILVKKNDYF